MKKILKIRNNLSKENFEKKTSLMFLDNLSVESDFEIEEKKFKHINNKLLFKNCFEKKIKNEKLSTYCKRISNVDLSKKKIELLKFDIGLNNLKFLKVLDLSNNSICRIENLKYFKNLQFLDLSNNIISEIEGLDKNKKLKTLNLNKNNISVIKNLENLTKLEDLSLNDQNLEEAENQELILDLKSFECLQNLKYLELNNNKICDYFPLSYLRFLKRLELNNTGIYSEKEICAFLPYLENLKSFDYYNNPLCKTKRHYELVVINSQECLIESNGKDIINLQRGFLKKIYIKKQNLKKIIN